MSGAIARFRHLFACVYALLLLAGCATQPPALTGDRAAAWLERRVQLSGLDVWRLSGRIAVQMDRDAFSANLFWQQDSGGYIVRVAAPLGRGTYELRGTADGVRLQTSDNRMLFADDAGTLMRENLGWELPVSGLAWWIRGLPEPGVQPSAMGVDAAGRLNNLTQSGWDVIYRRYESNGDLELPGKMELRNTRLKVRLVINEWSLEP